MEECIICGLMYKSEDVEDGECVDCREALDKEYQQWAEELHQYEEEEDWLNHREED